MSAPRTVECNAGKHPASGTRMNDKSSPLPRACHVQNTRCNGQGVQAVGIDNTVPRQIRCAVVKRTDGRQVSDKTGNGLIINQLALGHETRGLIDGTAGKACTDQGAAGPDLNLEIADRNDVIRIGHLGANP